MGHVLLHLERFIVKQVRKVTPVPELLLRLLTLGRIETTESPMQMIRLMEAKNSWSLHWPEYSPV